MISERSIDNVRLAADILEVAQQFISIEKRGSSYVACCPFHGEKTPSFHITPAKGIYKCFGCGKAGDSISFVREYEKMDFYEAIRWLADFYKIQLEEDDTKISAEKQDEIKEMQAVLNMAQKTYQDAFLELNGKNAHFDAICNDLFEKRFLTPDSVIIWQIGYAGSDWHTISKRCKEVGKVQPGINIGLISSKDEKFWDFLRDRITIPIHNHRGQLIGIAGRDLTGNEKTAKYVNPKESDLYKKDEVLFGLDKAAKAIRERGMAFLVEGYFDVIAMHQHGNENTVATCGTALTYGQCKLLAKYTKNVTVLRDSDNAGRKAANRDIDILTTAGFNVDVLFLDEGEDPDSFLAKGGDFKTAQKTAKDGLLYKASNLIEKAGGNTNEIVDAINQITQLLSLIDDDVKREAHANSIHKLLLKPHIKATAFLKKIRDIVNLNDEDTQYLEEGELPLPAGIDRDEFLTHGFYELVDGMHTGFYFATSAKHQVRLTNFVIKPLFHIYSKLDNRRLIEITNGKSTKIIELPSKSLISLEQFNSAIFDEGYFLTYGEFTRAHLLKIMLKIGDLFPLCYELKTLGWQPEGFWSYSNMVWADGEIKHFDEMGVVEVKEQKFISLAVSKVQADIRAEEDIYENDRYLSFRQAAIDFKRWAELMAGAYYENGWMGIAWSMVTIFRDIVFNVTKVPHLYAYGGVGAGKSEFGDSISNLFFNKMPAFNLNQGTDFAFFNRMERFRNTPNALNEFDEYSINEVWFRAIKSAYDGEGREKGRGSREKTRTQKITCTILLMGQYLSTKDDNSVLTRSIPLAFREVEKRPTEQTEAFLELKKQEEKGLSSILVELMHYRPLVKKNFAHVFGHLCKLVTDELATEGKSPKTRIIKNLCAPLTMVSILCTDIDESYTEQRLQLPFTFDQFYNYTKDMIVKMSETISESNALSEFWKYMEYLLDRGQILVDFDFKIEARSSVVIAKDGAKITKEFAEPKKLLLIRINNIHKLYQSEYRKNTAKNALNEQTLMTYIKDQPYYIGMNPGSNFINDKGAKVSTSSHVIDYDMLNISLERSQIEDERTPVVITGQVFKDAEMLPTNDTAKFTFAEFVQQPGDHGLSKTIPVYYTCYYSQPKGEWKTDLTHGMHVEITAMQTITIKGGNERKTLDIISYKTIQKT